MAGLGMNFHMKSDCFVPARFEQVHGHFGEQQGDAGQEKYGLAPIPIGVISDADEIEEKLAAEGIFVELVNIDWVKGLFEVAGHVKYREAAKSKLEEFYPHAVVSFVG
jgi:hypothetical protein